MSKTTLKDVAREAGVNFTLVSKMLTNNPNARISKETRKRIEAAIEKLGYRPSASARALRNGRSRAIGMVMRDLTNAYFAHVANAALKLFGSRGYQLLIALDDGGDGAVQSLLQRDVDGILYLGSKLPDVRKIPVPLVLNDCILDGADCVNINFDDALEVWRAHGMGGTTGALLVGVFASASINHVQAGVEQFFLQLSGILVTAAWSFCATWVILKVISRFGPIRVSYEQELEGLDEALHGESAYRL